MSDVKSDREEHEAPAADAEPEPRDAVTEAAPEASEAPAPAKEKRRRVRRRQKKERVLHTRVPAVLEQELKRLAESLRLPVSNVVRTILEDAVDTLDVAGRSAQEELTRVADRLGGPRAPAPDAPPAPKAPPPAPTYPLEGALGISRVRLVRATPCGLTGRELGAGEEALLVHFDDGRPPLAVAPDALPTPPGGGTPPTGTPPEGDPA